MSSLTQLIVTWFQKRDLRISSEETYDKMSDSIPFIRPPEELKVSTGNPAHAWRKWKQKFEIYLKATGTSKKSDEIKVGLLLNHIGDQCLEIYSNFQFLPERENPAGGENLPAENSEDYATVVGKFDLFFTKRDPQLMLREQFWYQLQRDPTQSFDSWVVNVKERAAECKFPPGFAEEAVRDKLTFSCNDDRSKIKLYDEGAKLTLDKTITILSMKEATQRELQESKTASIEVVHDRPVPAQRLPSKQGKYTNDKCGYCGRSHARGKINCPAANVRCDNCTKLGHFAAVCRGKQSKINEVQDYSPCVNSNPTFVGRVETDAPCREQTDKPQVKPGSSDVHENTREDNLLRQVISSSSVSTADQAQLARDPGWHIKLHIHNKELTWCIDTGAQVSVMPEQAYKESFGNLTSPDRRLVGAGDAALETIGQTDMKLRLGGKEINERVYVVRGAKKLLLGVPAIRKLGLIHEIPNTFSIRAIECEPKEHSPLDTKAKVLQHYPNLFEGLGKLRGEYTIRIRDGAVPFCLTTPRRVPILL